MENSLTNALPALTNIPGVAVIETGENSITVRFTDGKEATVTRDPLSSFLGRDEYDVHFPPELGSFVGSMARAITPQRVLELLNEMAAKAAKA